MSTNKPRIISIPATAPSQNNDSATFIGRVREVINVIRAGRPSAPVDRKKREKS
jgi:hypothetical protein